MSVGQIAFLGSGETSLAGGRIFELLIHQLSGKPQIAILETPAGFELNSEMVAGRVAEFLEKRLQNFRPEITIVPARKRGTDFSPDNPEIIKPLMTADLIFMGPGSPTYTVRQLKDSLAWDVIRARHRLGATLVFASAATIATGVWALPVYEIFKVGDDVHKKPGLDLLSDFNLSLNFIPHWNNAEGGADLDTSRCFIGLERFEDWCASLPDNATTLGLDEHTGLILDFQKGECRVSGVSSVSLVRECDPEIYATGSVFSMNELGEIEIPNPLENGLPTEVWKMVLEANQSEDNHTPSDDVKFLLETRQQARDAQNWPEADRLRDEIASLGWQVQDTPDGQKLAKT